MVVAGNVIELEASRVLGLRIYKGFRVNERQYPIACLVHLTSSTFPPICLSTYPSVSLSVYLFMLTSTYLAHLLSVACLVYHSISSVLSTPTYLAYLICLTGFIRRCAQFAPNISVYLHALIYNQHALLLRSYLLSESFAPTLCSKP